MIITISGLPGSGTSSVASELSFLTGYDVISTGALFRKKAADMHLSLEEFGRLADSDLSIDKELDETVIDLAAAAGDCLILEGRLVGHIVNSEKIPKNGGCLRVCLTAPFETRITRISKRDGLTKEEAEISTREREENELCRHEQNYGVNINTATYDVVFNTAAFSAFRIACIIDDMIVWQERCSEGGVDPDEL